MTLRSRIKIFNQLFVFISCVFLVPMISSCGKANTASPTGINTEYEIFNFSPDMGPVSLFINYNQVNAQGTYYTFNINTGYFYVPSLDTPYQFRSALAAGTPIFTRDDKLFANTKYSLFITGSVGNNTLRPILTEDSTTAPPIGQGKIRFVNASPTATGGLDLSANGTPTFSKITYPNVSAWQAIPVGNYDIKIQATGNTDILNEQPIVTVQDGRLYTIYAWGYTNRTDSAAFNAGVITNK